MVHFLYLVVLRFGCEVGKHHAVHAERAVVGVVAKVAAIGYVARAGGLVVVVNAVVNPFPYRSAANEVGRFYGVPVVYEVAGGVSHGVPVLVDVEGIFVRSLACGKLVGEAD